MLPKKFDQIAFGTICTKTALSYYYSIGVTGWIHDKVTANGIVYGEPVENVADLYFNYQFGYELEILQYEDPSKSWHKFRNENCNLIFPSHQGIHVTAKELADITKQMERFCEIVQDVKTVSHTNDHIKDERRYHYVIFDSIKELGFDLKLIHRLGLDYKPFK